MKIYLGITAIFFHVTSEVDTLILKKNSTDIRFHKKIANQDGKGYLFTTNFYKGANDDALLVPNNRYMEGDAAVHIEGKTFNKQ